MSPADEVLADVLTVIELRAGTLEDALAPDTAAHAEAVGIRRALERLGHAHAATDPEVVRSGTIAVVEAHAEIRALVARALTAAGYRAIPLATADELAAVDEPLAAIVTTADLASTTAPVVKLAKPFGAPALRAAIAHAIAPSTTDAPAASTAAPLAILIAEDDPLFRKILRRVLETAGYAPTLVADGKQALDALVDGRGVFDVVISDVQMPNFGGIELLRQVRRVDLDIPVILMSAAPSIASTTSAIEYGAFRYLVKPFDMRELVTLVGHATRARALSRIRRDAHALGTARGVGAAVDRAGIEVRFDQAIAQMWMAYQPIVDKHGKPFGAEALLRSREPSMADPGSILDAATQLQRLGMLGRRVRAAAAAGHAPTGLLFVNLHPDDLLDAELVDPSMPLTAIASRVVLEVTERAALASSPTLTERIEHLRHLGFRLAIDDIGAGYSGLTSFTEIVPEVVKLDMSLVRDVHRSLLKQRTIAALCTLCHEVGSLVVGEGVETPDERDCLVALGCDLLQGYLIGRPSSLPTT